MASLIYMSVLQAVRWFAIFASAAYSAKWLLDHTGGALLVVGLLIWVALVTAAVIYSKRLVDTVFDHLERGSA